MKPDLGKFKRLGMDVVVNAVWLAYFWAKQEGDPEAVTALETLILDGPFDFILIEGNSNEEIEVNTEVCPSSAFCGDFVAAEESAHRLNWIFEKQRRLDVEHEMVTREAAGVWQPARQRQAWLDKSGDRLEP